MPLVRILIIFTIGILYGIFSQGISLNEEQIAYIFGLSIGFMVTSLIFAVIIYGISRIFNIPTSSKIEQNDDLILDAEYSTIQKQQITNIERFTKYWLTVAIIIFVLITLNTIVQPI